MRTRLRLFHVSLTLRNVRRQRLASRRIRATERILRLFRLHLRISHPAPRPLSTSLTRARAAVWRYWPADGRWLRQLNDKSLVSPDESGWRICSLLSICSETYTPLLQEESKPGKGCHLNIPCLVPALLHYDSFQLRLSTCQTLNHYTDIAKSLHQPIVLHSHPRPCQ